VDRSAPQSGGEWLFHRAKAGLPLRVHPHMLRHACGYKLAEQGTDTRLIQDHPGHCNIPYTLHFTAGNAARFVRVWTKKAVFY